MAIGIHFAWNFTQAGLFGVNVSGVSLGGLLESMLSGPDLISGGSFGVEASLFTVALGLALGVFFLVLAHRRGNFIAPFWGKRRRWDGTVRMMRYGDLTYEQIRDCASRGWLAIVPTGCTEQQGPTLTRGLRHGGSLRTPASQERSSAKLSSRRSHPSSVQSESERSEPHFGE